MTMIDSLTTFSASSRESQAEDDVVKTEFKESKQVRTGIAIRFFSSIIDQFELFLQYTINEAKLLFFYKLASMVCLLWDQEIGTTE